MAATRKPAAKKKAAPRSKGRQATKSARKRATVSKGTAAPAGSPTSLIAREDWDMKRLVQDMTYLQMATREIPGMVSDEVRKNWRQLEKAYGGSKNSGKGPQGFFLDPFELQMQMGWKERRVGVTYDRLKQIKANLAVLNAIIRTRIAQISAFLEPYDETNALGFVIRHKDRHRGLSSSERRRIREIEGFFLNCGWAPQEPGSRVKRDKLPGFVAKFMHDSLLLDQGVAQLVPGKSRDYPISEFYAMDGSTFRIAVDNRDVNELQHASGTPKYDDAPFEQFTADGKRVKYLQILHNVPRFGFAEDEIVFAIRNPRTDLHVAGYGEAECEAAIRVVTALLNAEEYHARIFSTSSIPKGFLNLKGTDWTPEQLEGFKRSWYAQLQGVHNAHKTPVIQFDGDVQWVNMQPSARDMEFGKYLQFELACLCGVYLIDPAEISHPQQGGVSQTPLFEASAEWKLQASKDRGLKPLLRFLAGVFQEILDRIDPHFSFRFVGLDEPSDKEKHERRLAELSAFRKLNEVRRAAGLPDDDTPAGDMVMSPQYLQARQLAMSEKQMAQWEKQGGNAQEQPTPGGNGQGNGNGSKRPEGQK